MSLRPSSESHPIYMSNVIGSSRESNPFRRVCTLCTVTLGHVALQYREYNEDLICFGLDLIDELYKSINDCWMSSRSTLPFLSLHSIMKAHAFLGLSHDAVRFLVEQLPGARHCPRYKAKYHKHNKTKEEVRSVLL